MHWLGIFKGGPFDFLGRGDFRGRADFHAEDHCRKKKFAHVQ